MIKNLKMNSNIFLAALLFFIINSYAQVTLKQHHFFAVGDSIVEYYNRLPQNPIDLGEPGENKVWDFSNLNAIAVNKQTIKFLDPKKTPFHTEYPNSNIVLYSNNGYETWSFMKITENKIANLGYGLFINKEKRTGNYGGIDMNLPLKYLEKSSNEITNERVLFKNKKGQDSIKVRTVHNHRYEIDSWGDVILPKGRFLSLRLKYTLHVTNYTYQKQAEKWDLLGKPETSTTISYKWWTDDKNTKYPVVQIVMDNAHKKPIVVQYLEATPFSELLDEVQETSIKIYPNPATEKLFVEIPTTEETYTTIYSIQGKMVKNLKSNISKIEIDVNDLPVGLYLIISRSKAGKIIGKSKFVKKL